MASILLVEDDQMTQVLMRNLLAKADMEVAGASSYEEALQMAGALVPDLILMDILLPGAQGDGWAAASAIRADPALQDIPIIIITAGGNAEKRMETDKFEGYFQKPFRTRELLDHIVTCLRE